MGGEGVRLLNIQGVPLGLAGGGRGERRDEREGESLEDIGGEE